VPPTFRAIRIIIPFIMARRLQRRTSFHGFTRPTKEMASLSCRGSQL